jgi:hypothetical protein
VYVCLRERVSVFEREGKNVRDILCGCISVVRKIEEKIQIVPGILNFMN